MLLLVLERFFGRRDTDKLLDHVGALISHAKLEREKLIDEFARERAELLIRIQHPGIIVPPRAAGEDKHEPPEEDEFGMVGQVMEPLLEEPEE